MKMTALAAEDIEQTVASLREICEHQPETMIWVTPVYHDDDANKTRDIIDFKVWYANSAIIELTGRTRDEIVGRCIRADKVPDPSITEFIFQQCFDVYTSGEPLQYPYYSQQLDKHIILSRSKVKGGVLTSARNRTEEQHTKQEKEAQSRFIESLIDNSPYGISVYESIRDASNEIVDFKLKLANKKSSEITAFSPEQLQEFTVKQLIALRGHSDFFEACAGVVNTGKSRYIEYYAETRDQWIGFSIMKFEDGYLLNYIDISETKKYEQEAKRHAQELDALFNSSVSVVYSATVVRNSSQAIVDIIFLRVNESFQRIFNLSAEEVVGRRLSLINVHDDHATFLRYIDEAMKSGTPSINQLKYSNPDRWFEMSIVRLDASTVSVTLNDITAEKTASLEIERQRNLLDAILKQIPNGLAITKALRDENGKMIDGITVLANEACEKLNGVPGEILLNTTVATLDPSFPDNPLFAMASDLAVGASLRTEFFLENTQKWVELAVARMDTDHFINVMTDITALKSAHQKLETTVAEVQEANANLEQFAYAASHDLKEPVRKIRMYSEQIKRGYGASMNDAHIQQFEKLEAAADRMGALIENLLLYAHANTGIPQVEPVDLNILFQNVIDDLEFAIRDTSASVQTEKLPVVSGYKPQLHQLFQNLLANAIKYHKTGEPPLIHVSYSTSKGNAQFGKSNPDSQDTYHVIEVRDNGIGFEQIEADRIFQVFTRLHSKHQYPGTGVGLSIVKKAVENHGGYVSVKSAPGEGSSFTVYLPIDETEQT